MQPIKDKYGRQFQSLRVSLTDLCNMKCIYCVSDALPIVHQKGLDYITLSDKVIELNNYLNLKDIRITGGEPTVYPYFLPFIKRLSENSIENIKVTTNGLNLKPFIQELKECNVNEINFSLDSLEETTFYKITGKNKLGVVLENIQLCIDAGIKVKINTVLLKGINDHEILHLLTYFKNKNVSIRFLELMRMGHLYSRDFDNYFIGQEKILDIISDQFPLQSMGRKVSATAQYWQLENGYQFGIIANESVPFCNDCNRLRLDSKGKLYGCLSKNNFVSTETIKDQDTFVTAIKQALTHKQAHKFVGSDLSMLEIGG